MSRSTAVSGERVFTRNFLYIFFATFAFFAGFIFFFPVLPIFIDALGGTPTLIGALLGGSSIISICLRPFSGRLVDEQGRKRYITLGAVLLTASSFSYGLVSDTVLLWPARLAGGAGISLFFTASLAYAGDITPASKRGQMMGYWGMANNLAVALGPLLGVAILKANFLHGFEQELRRWYPGSGSDVGGADLNFATAFLTAGVIGLVCIVLTRRITEVYTPVKQPKGLGAQTPQGNDQLEGHSACLAEPAHGAELRRAQHLRPHLRRGARRGERRPLVLHRLRGVHHSLRLFAGPLLDRFPRAYSIVPGFVLMSAATMLIGLVQAPWILPIGAAMVGLGSGFVQPGLQALLLDKAGGERLGSASATFALAVDFGLFGGGFIMGLILELAGFRVMYLTAGMAGLTAAAVLAAASWREARAATARG